MGNGAWRTVFCWARALNGLSCHIRPRQPVIPKTFHQNPRRQRLPLPRPGHRLQLNPFKALAQQNTVLQASYMTQMGGDSLLDYACYYAREPFGMLRLAYGSLLGSWALLNCGDEESGYGYWFPGKEKDLP